MERYELLLRSEFSAAHRLRLADGGLEPLHGHNWQVEVYLEGARLRSTGYLADFTALQRELGRITGDLHDSYLNEVAELAADNPTTERVARYLHDRLASRLPGEVRIAKVRVWETRGCAAAYIPDG